LLPEAMNTLSGSKHKKMQYALFGHSRNHFQPYKSATQGTMTGIPEAGNKTLQVL
jgi:hypothetical protein